MILTHTVLCAAATILSQEQLANPWLADLEQLASAVRSEWSYYADRTSRGDVDLDALIERARGQIDLVSQPADFVSVVERIVAGLHDGHAGVWASGRQEPSRWLPFEVVEAREGILVSGVRAGVELGAEAPRPGERWIAVDGRAVEELVAQHESLCFGSTAAGRRSGALERALRTDSLDSEVSFEDGAGARRTVRVPTTASAGDSASPAASWSLRWPREDVAVLRIASFQVADWEAWREAAPEEREGFLASTKRRVNELFREIAARSPRALILDVRGNGGGTDLLGIHVAEHLIEGTFRYFLLSAPVDGRWAPPAGLSYGTEEGMQPYRGPLIALIDSACFSTTDNLLRCLDDLHPEFTTIGRPTGGGTGAPRSIVRLEHSQIDVTLCTHRVYGPKGELIEGRGTTPDVPITWTRADLVSGADPDLAAALARVDSLERGR